MRPFHLYWIVPALLGTSSPGLAQEPGAPVPPLPRFGPVEPGEAPATLRAREGFVMTLLAAEPMLTDPVAGVYDEDGRLYVAEMNDYPHVDPAHDRPFAENVEDPPVGRIRLLIDRDGDGRFDESHLFAEQISWPTGLAVWKGGLFVAATPEILYLKDHDGDHKADERRAVFRGFRKYNIQAVMNNLQWGLDHAIYAAASGNGGEVRPVDRIEARPVPVLRRDFRFEPATDSFGAISGGARFGNTFDDWGNRFLCDIRNPAEHVVLPNHYLDRNPYLPAPRVLHDAAPAGDNLPVYRISPAEPWRELRAQRWAKAGKVLPRSELVGAGVVTSSSGITVYRGDAYPAPFRGNLFVGEVAGNLIHRMTVEPDGATFRARRADERAEFVASTDTWFRPVNFINAPDGSLHVLDMYRETIEHPWSIPDDIKARLDLRSGADRGRIYRLEPPGFRPRPTPRLSQASTAELIALLEHPNAWHRDSAHRLLFERQDRSAVEPLRLLLQTGESALGRLHALWSMHGLAALTDEDLAVALEDPSPGVREHGVRLAEGRLAHAPRLRDRVLRMATDESARVRFQVAFTLGELTDDRATRGLSEIAVRDAEDPWTRAAVLSSASRDASGLFRTLLAARARSDGNGRRETLRSLLFVIGARGDAAQAAAALDAIAGEPEADALDLALALGDGMRRGRLRLFDLADAGDAENEGAKLLIRLAEAAEPRSANPAIPDSVRAAWIELAGHRGFEAAGELLTRRLAASEPTEVRKAAVRALGLQDEPAVADMLIAAWPGLTPSLRSEVIQTLLSRPIWLAPLLRAIEAGVVEVGQVPPARRTLLLSSPNAEVRRMAERVFPPPPSASQPELVTRYRKALEGRPDPDAGRGVFRRECLACHRLGDEGHVVGPNLASIRGRTPEDILIHILEPNREVAPDFLEYTVELKDGRVLTGLIESETATSLTLKRGEGATDSALRQDVERIGTTGKSLMPEGLDSRIPPDEMADLIGFLLELQK